MRRQNKVDWRPGWVVAYRYRESRVVESFTTKQEATQRQAELGQGVVLAQAYYDNLVYRNEIGGVINATS